MVKSYICYLFVCSILFMGIEGVIDDAHGEHDHRESHAHASVSNDADTDQISSDSHGEDGCSHCCHTHTSSLTAGSLATSYEIADQQIAFYQAHFLNFSQAPPTPPPNVQLTV